MKRGFVNIGWEAIVVVILVLITIILVIMLIFRYLNQGSNALQLLGF